MRTLLVGKVGVVDQGQAAFITALSQHSVQLGGGGPASSWDDQRGIPEVDDGDFAAVIDAPPVAQRRRKAGLASVGDSGSRYGCRHDDALYLLQVYKALGTRRRSTGTAAAGSPT